MPVLIDWTSHRDRCKSLGLMLPVGGRAVPLSFWLAPSSTGGRGSQRQLEDAALQAFAAWLPRGRRAVLLGDRGFQGAHRMRFLRKVGLRFVLRVTATTMLETQTGWVALRSLPLALGARHEWERVRLGRHRPVDVHVVAVRQPLLTPRRRWNAKGKATGAVETDCTWFLATDLPLRYDIAALYALRVQIEQSFRDEKDLFGLEEAATQQPAARLHALLWAVMIGRALALRESQTPPLHVAPLPLKEGASAPSPAETPPAAPTAPPRPRDRRERATREGLHVLVVSVWQGRSPFQEDLAAIQAQCERMQARPQVCHRRLLTPSLRNRERRSPARQAT